MVVKRDTAKKAEQRRISQIGDFKKRMGGEMELPSGLIARVRNPGGMQSFMTGGAIPNNLMVIIKNGLSKGKAPEATELMNSEGGFDEEMLQDMTALLDAVVVKVMVEPRVAPRLTQADVDAYNTKHPEEPVESIEDLRSDHVLYADEIPDDDKNFLFQWLSGGTRDLEEFRKQSKQHVDSVAAVPSNVSDPVADNGADAG